MGGTRPGPLAGGERRILSARAGEALARRTEVERCPDSACCPIANRGSHLWRLPLPRRLVGGKAGGYVGGPKRAVVEFRPHRRRRAAALGCRRKRRVGRVQVAASSPAPLA